MNDEKKLTTAVLGLNDAGWNLLKAASQIEHFQIIAVSDSDSKSAEKAAKEYDCTAYDDYRQLIIQNQLDCLLVAAGIHSCDEYIRIAMKKKFNVLKAAPPARNFEETVEFVRLAEAEKVKFAVANPARFAESFTALRQYIETGQIEQIFLITVNCNFGGQSYPSWQNDPELAGGGVLLHSCYQIIDQILLNFQVPEQVYSLNTNSAGDRQQRHYLTEDTAVVTMKITDNLFCNLTASRHTGPMQQGRLLNIYGKDKILTVDDTQLTISNAAGQQSHKEQYRDDEICRTKKMLENLALSILSPEENKFSSSGRENLKNMAVIESAYLSARTGVPEEPARIMKME